MPVTKTMSSFVQYIREFDSNPPPEGLLDLLAQFLRAEMRRRALWTAPPKWLGVEYLGVNSWNSDHDAFTDLLFDCYVYILKHLKSLRNQLEAHDEINIDGLVALNIKHFLTEKQSSENPQSYAIGSNVKAAVLLAIDNKMLTTNTEKLSNDTLLTFSTTSPQNPISEEILLNVLRCQTDLPNIREDLLTKRSQSAGKKMAEIIGQLAKNGITSFRYADLMKMTKEEVQSGWHLPETNVTEETDSDGNIQRVKIIFDDTNYQELQQSMAALFKQIEEEIEGLSHHSVLKEKIKKVFQAMVGLIEAGETPTQVELVRILGDIPRNTVSRIMTILRKETSLPELKPLLYEMIAAVE
jgi:hypothetical protein